MSNSDLEAMTQIVLSFSVPKDGGLNRFLEDLVNENIEILGLWGVASGRRFRLFCVPGGAEEKVRNLLKKSRIRVKTRTAIQLGGTRLMVTNILATFALDPDARAFEATFEGGHFGTGVPTRATGSVACWDEPEFSAAFLGEFPDKVAVELGGSSREEIQAEGRKRSRRA
jgi:hypothetical protein